jgi:hypothetical protein
LLEMMFTIWYVQSGYEEENWDNQFSWQLKVWLWRKELVARVAVKGRLYVCSSYSETVIITALKSIARIRLVNTEKT